MLRVCTRCGIGKTDDDFSGKRNECRSCKKASNAEYQAKNKEKIKEQQRGYREANRDRKKAYNAEYGAKNSEKIRARQKVYREANKETLSANSREYGKKHYAENKERVKKTQAAYYAANSEKVLERQTAYQKNNPEKVKSRQKKYREANPEKVKELSADWTRRNMPWVVAKTKARRILKKTAARLGNIEETCRREAEIRRANPGMHIDHIVPLTPPLAMTLGGMPVGHRSKLHGPRIPLVYGFHHPNNWQVLTPAENIRKSNRDWPDSPWS